MKKTVAIVTALLLTALSFCFSVSADTTAKDITKNCEILISGKPLPDDLGSNYTVFAGKKGEQLTVSGKEIYHIALQFRHCPEKEYTAVADGEEIICGQYGYLHEVIHLTGASEVSVTLPDSVCGVFVYSKGVLPENVQDWQPALDGGCDILVFATHFDDDTLFFGAAISKYVDEGKTVQVVHMVNHDNTKERPHEVLDGLWEMGVRNYPLASPYGDKYCGNLAKAMQIYDIDGVTEHLVRAIRRFKPLVVVAHDINGEYGHGAHCMNGLVTSTIAEKCRDISYQPITAACYGLWVPQKIYLHLYKGELGTVTLDVKAPLTDGRTALQTAADAMDKHISQRKWGFAVTTKGVYDCRSYGLVFSAVGADSGENDFFENLD